MYTIEKVSTLASKSVPLSLVLEATLLYSWLFCAGGNLGVDSDHRLQKIVHDLLQVSYYISARLPRPSCCRWCAVGCQLSFNLQYVETRCLVLDSPSRAHRESSDVLSTHLGLKGLELSLLL
jgi:hypothetical protein